MRKMEQRDERGGKVVFDGTPPKRISKGRLDSPNFIRRGRCKEPAQRREIAKAQILELHPPWFSGGWTKKEQKKKVAKQVAGNSEQKKE